GVGFVGFCSGEGEVGGFPEGVRTGDCADEESFGFGRAPGFVGDTAECEACGLDGVAAYLEAGCDGDQGEGVALAVADLEVVGVLGELWRGEFDCGDELVGLEVGVELWSGAGESVEVGDGDGAFALGALDVDGGVEGGESYVHIAG